MMDYKAMKLTELREQAKAKGLHGVSAMRKDELIRTLELSEKAAAKETEKKTGKNSVPRTVKAEEPRRNTPRERVPHAQAAGRTNFRRPAEPKEEADTSAVQERRSYRRPMRQGRQPETDRGTERMNPRRPMAARSEAESVKPTERAGFRRPMAQRAEGETVTPQERGYFQRNQAASAAADTLNGTGRTNYRRPTLRNTETENAGGEERPARTDWRPEAPARSAVNETESRSVFERRDNLEAHIESTHRVEGYLEVMSEGFGFIRSNGYMSGENDTYVTPPLIRRFRLKTGDYIVGIRREKSPTEKTAALQILHSANGMKPNELYYRPSFEKFTPIFPDERYQLETDSPSVAMRIMNLITPVGKGQRGLIVAPPKAGKTTLLKEIAKSILGNHPDIHLMILLIDERPEEVTDIRESILGDNVEVMASTFDELPEHHKHISELAIERAKRLVEQKKDVVILLDSITRLTRAYNITGIPSGRTLSGGLDPASLHMPKRFFGAARNTREAGSLTILATALIETGSKLDDVVYEEFKGTGNMELTLSRRLQERRIFPAIDISKSGTRREDLLLTEEEQLLANKIRQSFLSEKDMEQLISLCEKAKSREELTKLIMG